MNKPLFFPLGQIVVVFIYTLDMGVARAAIATAISQIVSTLVYLCYILKRKSVFHFRIKECCFSKEIMSMGSLVVFGFLKGFQPIAGFSYGAKKFDRLHKAIKTSILWSTIFCTMFGLVAAMFSTQIMTLFTKGDMEMVRVGSIALRANGISFILFGFYTVYSFLFLVMGKAKEGCILGACRQGICFVPVILLLPSLLGLNGILYAQPIADVLSAVITAFMAIHIHKELS